MLKYALNGISAIANTYLKLRRARDILNVIGQNPELCRIHEGFYRQVPLSLVTNPIKSFPRLFLRQSRYSHNSQRPRFYIPALEAKPWWPSDTNSTILVHNLDIIAKEFNDTECRIRSHPQEYLVNEGNWSIFPLFRSRKIEENCYLCPQTTAIVESLPLCDKVLGLVYFSVIVPGTKIRAHCGPVNTRIRYHLTLSSDAQAWICVDAEKRTWKPGECLVFDDSFEHEVQHHGHAPRVVLVVDCWHPGLSALEREWVEGLYAEITRRK